MKSKAVRLLSPCCRGHSLTSCHKVCPLSALWKALIPPYDGWMDGWNLEADCEQMCSEYLHMSVLWSVMSGQSNSSQSQAGAGIVCERREPLLSETSSTERRETGEPEEVLPAAHRNTASPVKYSFSLRDLYGEKTSYKYVSNLKTNHQRFYILSTLSIFLSFLLCLLHSFSELLGGGGWMSTRRFLWGSVTLMNHVYLEQVRWTPNPADGL